jgi:hypothetical protein
VSECYLLLDVCQRRVTCEIEKLQTSRTVESEAPHPLELFLHGLGRGASLTSCLQARCERTAHCYPAPGWQGSHRSEWPIGAALLRTAPPPRVLEQRQGTARRPPKRHAELQPTMDEDGHSSNQLLSVIKD